MTRIKMSWFHNPMSNDSKEGQGNNQVDLEMTSRSQSWSAWTSKLLIQMTETSPILDDMNPTSSTFQSNDELIQKISNEVSKISKLGSISIENESISVHEENGGMDFVGNETEDEMYWPLRDPLTVVIPITVIYGLILMTGLLGNIVTCVVIIRSRYLHTATNYYLFSLAVSDLVLLLSGLPAEMHLIWRRYPDIFGEAFCFIRGLASETSANATVLTITAFTVERYLAICRPFMIQKWQNKLTRVIRQILVIWALSIALAIPQALQLGLAPLHGLGKDALICTVKNIVIEHSFEIATFVFFVGPMILITALYCLIGLTLHNSSQVNESKLQLRKSLSGHKREVGQQRVLKMLVAVVAAFFICWAPFHAQRLLAIWGVTWLDSSETLRRTYHILTYISGVLYYLSTCINPILYHIMSLKFRHAFQAMMMNNGCYAAELTKRKQRERNIGFSVGCNGNQFFDRSLSTRSSRSANALTIMELTNSNTITILSNNNTTGRHYLDKPNPAVHFGPIASV